MIEPAYLFFEAATYILFALCLWHAARNHGRYRVLELVITLVYGVLLEWATMRQMESYHYGRFLIMIDNAPLPIGMGWAVIIYSAMEFTARLKLPEHARPFLNGLLALNIDLAMDAVAIRLMDTVNNQQGMWTWTIPLDREWFGVPWGNFWGWFIVVTSFSGFLYLLRRWREHRVGGWLYAPLALALSVGTLLLLDQLYGSVLYPNGLGFVGPAVLIGGGAALVLASRPRVEQAGPPEPVVLAVPLAFHLIFIFLALVQGIYTPLPILAVISVAMLLVGVALHLWPWWVGRQQTQSSVQQSPSGVA